MACVDEMPLLYLLEMPSLYLLEMPSLYLPGCCSVDTSWYEFRYGNTIDV